MAEQDWFDKDFYATLGVSKDADAQAIKKSYRKLARTYHPDQNPGDAKAEERFKEVSEAYSVLSDAEKRKEYDAVRQMAAGGARFSAGPGGSTAGGFEDLFGGMFGGDPGGGSRVRFSTGGGGGGINLQDLFGGGFSGSRSQRGQDLSASVSLDFDDAVRGSTVSLKIGGRTIKTRIPAGVHDGQRIRLRGKGGQGSAGGEAGDLLLTVSVKPDRLFTISGNNLKIIVPVSFSEAALGATIKVPTFGGGAVSVKVPPGTPSGRTLRVKGYGVETKKGRGDLLVTVQVAVPERLNKEARKAVEAFAEATKDDDPRRGLV